MFIQVDGVRVLKDGKRSTSKKAVNTIYYDDITMFFLIQSGLSLVRFFIPALSANSNAAIHPVF